MKRSLYSRETHKNGNINSLNKQKHAYNSIFWEYRCESGIVKNGVPLKIMPSVPLKYLKMVEIKPLLRSSCWTMQLLLSSFNPCSCWSTQQLWLPFTRNPSLKGSILPYTVQFTLTLYATHFTLYTVCCTLKTVHCTLHTVNWTLHAVNCTLDNAHLALHNAVYTVCYTFHTVNCAL